MLHYILLLSAACLFFMFTDIKKRKLSNFSLLFFFAFQLFYLIHYEHFYLNTAVVVLFVGMMFFCFNILAAGDVKLAFIMAMAVKLEHLNYSVIIMLFSGGIQAVYYLLKHYWCSYRYGKSDVLQRGLPYGVAICIGFYIGALLSLN